MQHYIIILENTAIQPQYSQKGKVEDRHIGLIIGVIIIIMWIVKTKVISVIIGATGTISKSCRKYVSSIPGNQEFKELKKTAILDTAHILRKVLTQRYNGVNAGTSNICIMNSYIRIAATQCSLGRWFVSGI